MRLLFLILVVPLIGCDAYYGGANIKDENPVDDCMDHVVTNYLQTHDLSELTEEDFERFRTYCEQLINPNEEVNNEEPIIDSGNT
jgi:hypothetical protein